MQFEKRTALRSYVHMTEIREGLLGGGVQGPSRFFFPHGSSLQRSNGSSHVGKCPRSTKSTGPTCK